MRWSRWLLVALAVLMVFFVHSAAKAASEGGDAVPSVEVLGCTITITEYTCPYCEEKQATGDLILLGVMCAGLLGAARRYRR